MYLTIKGRDTVCDDDDLCHFYIFGRIFQVQEPKLLLPFSVSIDSIQLVEILLPKLHRSKQFEFQLRNVERNDALITRLRFQQTD